MDLPSINFPQNVIWRVTGSNGMRVFEFDDKGENSFNALLNSKSLFKTIALIDTVNKKEYVINLETGAFYLNGVKLVLSKNLDGRQHYFYNLPTSYADGVIQYKCSNPISMGDAAVTAATYNIGYKIPWGLEFWNDDNEGRTVKNFITHVQAMLTVDAKTLDVGVSTLFTCRSEDRHGNIRNFKL